MCCNILSRTDCFITVELLMHYAADALLSFVTALSNALANQCTVKLICAQYVHCLILLISALCCFVISLILYGYIFC